MVMKKRKTAAVVLAGGSGTRMKSALPKALHPLAGRPMLGHQLATLEAVELDRILVVVAAGREDVAAAAAPFETVVQTEPRGTADAVLRARDALRGFDGTVLVLYADTPLVSAQTLNRGLTAFEAEPGLAILVLAFEAEYPADYGRLVTESRGGLAAIIEARDATETERQITLCNSGIMAVDGARLFDFLDQVGNENAKREYYLTDIVAVACAIDARCAYIEAPEQELRGVNSRAELARAEALIQARLRAAAMAAGATLLDPDTVYLSHDTRLGRDVTIGPNVFFGPGVTVEDAVDIRAFCHIEGTTIRASATVGPFARLRPGADIGSGARIGNFVEVKQATIEAGAKANHLSYIGDTRVGAEANIGAGTITCNYDGFTKSRTDIGEGAFIGSNTALVAPVKVGDGAVIGAGSVISRDVPADALALTRAAQKSVPGWATRKRARKAKKEAVAQAAPEEDVARPPSAKRARAAKV